MSNSSTLMQDEPTPGVIRLSGLTEISGRPARFNSYLLRTGDQWIWVDPGPEQARDEIFSLVGRILGDWNELRLVVASCLEAESVANLPVALRQAPKAGALMTLETWGFVEMMDVSVDRVLLANHFRDGLRLGSSGATLRIILNPYQQFSGALAMQETSTGALLTGGLLANRQSLSAWATDAEWDTMAEHACRQLPCQEALRWSVGRIRALPQGVTVALPLWGPGISADGMTLFLDRLEALPVGADLLASAETVVEGSRVIEIPA